MESIRSSRRQFLTAGGLSAAALGVLGNGRPIAAEATKGNTMKWWESQYRILQTNLREIDVLQDPREIARAVREFGATTIVTNIGGIIAFYPTKLELQHINPYLKGDFAGEMIEAARSEGLNVVGRFDLSKAMGKAYDAHPDWFMLNRDGTPREYNGTYQACPNSGWAQEYGFEILAEAVPRYLADTYFFNMTGYPTTDYSNVNHGICVCEDCQRRFRDMYGLSLPEKDGFQDPNWVPYLQFQDRTSFELAGRAQAFIKPMTSAPIMNLWNFDTIGRGEIHRRVDSRGPEWPHGSGDQARWAMARNPGRPFSSTSTAHVDYPWRQAMESAPCHLLRFAQQLGVGAKLDLYLMGTIADQDDPSYLPPVSELYKWHEAHKAHYEGLEPSANVALYSSYAQARLGYGTRFGNSSDAYRGAYSALVDARIPFWMVSDQRVADGTTDLSAYDVIVMPKVELISDAEVEAIDTYVEQGGTLVVTGRAGSKDENAKLRSAIPFRSFPGTSYGEALNARGWSANLDTASLQIGAGRMVVDGEYHPMTLREGAETLLSLAPEQRFGPPEFVYAIPGDKPRGDPVVLERRYGKGHVIHVPWSADELYYRHGLVNHRDLIAALVDRHAAPRRFVLEGAGPVELMVMHQRGTGRRVLHVINYAGQRDGLYDWPPANEGLRLGVRGDVASAVDFTRDLKLRGQETDGYTWFDLPPVETFAAISLKV